MSHKLSFFVLLMLSMGVPFLSTSAQTQPAQPFRQCYPIAYTLHAGARGSDVVTLQTFLSQQGYFAYQPIGVYGPKTYSAVKAFQAAQGLPQTGTVGPLTRAAFKRVCYPLSSVSVQSISPSAASIGDTATVYGSGFTANNAVLFNGFSASSVASFNGGTQLSFTVPQYIGPNCRSGMYCAQWVRQLTSGIYQLSIENDNGTSNQIPFTVLGVSTTQTLSITSLDAPTQLLVGKMGTWTVHTVNQGQTLNYSVCWGDESVVGMYGASSAPTNNVQSSATFTHVYTQEGTYTPVFTVTDPLSGHQASASATVSVIRAQPVPY